MSDGATLANLNLADPTLATHAANKKYVDNAIQGLNVKNEVQAATAATLPSNTYNNGTSGVGATLTATTNGALVVDGYTVLLNDRILVKNESPATNNGIYLVTQTGDALTPYILTRTSDADTGPNLSHAFVLVTGGNTFSGTSWTMNVIGPIVIGFTSITWAQFATAGAYTANLGLTLSGTEFNANTDGTTTYIDGSNNVAVKSSTTSGQVLLSQGSASAAWGAVNLGSSDAVTGTLLVGNGGTGQVSFTTNGILYGNSTSGLQVTSAGTQYNVLVAGSSSVPTFGTVNLASSDAVGSSILPLANGGSNAALTASAGSIVYSTSSALAFNAVGTSGYVLLSGGTGEPTWSSIGSIAVTSGANEGSGTGVFDATNSTSSTLKFKTLTTTSNTLTITDNGTSGINLEVDQGNLNINSIGGSPLSVTNGGTGKNSVGFSKVLVSDPTTANTYNETAISSLAITLLGDTTTSDMQSTLGLVIGTNVEAYSANLSSIAALSGTGLVVQTTTNTFVERQVVADSSAGYQGLQVTNTAGVAGDITVGLDIDGLTLSASPADAWEVPVYDGTNNKKTTLSDIKSYISASVTPDPLFSYGSITTTTANVGASLPTHARVIRVAVKITTPYTSGTNIAVLDSYSNVLAANADIDAQNAGLYIIDLIGTDFVSDGQATASITGSPVAGTATISIDYRIIA